MRVAAVVEQNWHTVPGGTATSINAMLAAIQTAAPDIELIGLAAKHDTPPKPSFATPIDVAHFKIKRRALYTSWLATRKPKVQKVAGDVDLIHATTAAIPPKTAPLVATVHDLAFLHFPDHASKAGQRFFLRSWQIIKKEADLILCPSQTTAADCVDNGADENKVRVVPWGVHKPVVSGADIAAIRAEYNLPERFALFVGTIEPRKNLRRLIAALGGQDIPLVIAGPAGWDDSIHELAAPLGAMAHYVGFLEHQQLHALYAASTMLVWPTLFEGFGLPVLEAMAHGTPVVTSAGTSAGDVVADAGVLVDPKSISSIGQGIADLWASDADRNRLGLAGAERAKEFTWERTAELTIDAYRSLTA